MGARAVANDARRVGLAAVRQSRLARAANGQAMEALEPLHDELAMSPVGSVLVLGPVCVHHNFYMLGRQLVSSHCTGLEPIC